MRWLCLGLFLCFSGCLHGQLVLDIQSDATHEVLDKTVKALPKSFSDLSGANSALTQLIQDLRNEGFLESSIDSMRLRDSLLLVKLHLGEQYQWFPIDFSEISPEIQRATGLDQINWKKHFVQLDELRIWEEKLLEYAENNGHPFARTWLEPEMKASDQLGGQLQLELGPAISIDSLAISGDLLISADFLQQYLGMEPGDPFSKSKMEQAANRLRDLPFIQLQQAPNALFSLNKARINIPANKRKASRFDFIIGVLPNNTQTDRLLVTADLEGELYNAFGRGERLYAHFEQLRPATQELELAFQYPYFFQLPFGADFAFNLYRRDSAFLDVELDLGIQYLLEGGNYIKAFWRQQNSNLLEINEALILAQQALPEQLDIRNSSFGLELLQQNLDYRFNPRRGWMLKARAGAGTKRILRNTQIEELELGNLYDSLTLSSFQYQIQAEAALYLPFFKRTALKIGANTGFLLSNEAIYQNEQFRIGGNRLLRGFDEEFFFATNYLVGTLEYRLLLSQNSFLFTFLDAGWLENRTPEVQQVDFPFGFGAGISLETRAGLFGISLAFGSQTEGSVNLNSPKVHFGYVSLF